MKKALIFLTLASIFLIQDLSGQTARLSTEQELLDFMTFSPDLVKNKKTFYARVDGSPYLSETFAEGTVSILANQFSGVMMRYNAYEGWFEVETSKGIRHLDPERSGADTVWLGGETFVHVPFKAGKALKTTYMVLQNDSPTSVLMYREIKLLEAEEAKGYADAKPARFFAKPGTWYIQSPGQPAMQIKGKKDLHKIFPEKHHDLAVYLKHNKLKLKDPEHLAQLCAYADSLD